MTPRTRARIQIAAVIVLVAGGLIAVSGCDPRTLAYFLQPFESTIPPPKGPSLEDKKVVILCNVDLGGCGGISRRWNVTFPANSADILQEEGQEDHRSSSLTRSRPGWKLIRTGPTPPMPPAISTPTSRSSWKSNSFRSRRPGDLNMVHGESKVHIQVFEMDYPKNSKDRPIKDQPKEAHNIYDEYAETHLPEPWSVADR